MIFIDNWSDPEIRLIITDGKWQRKRKREGERARKGDNPSAATESAFSSTLSGHFGSKVRQGTAPLYIEATRLLLLLLSLPMLLLLLLLLLMLLVLLVVVVMLLLLRWSSFSFALSLRAAWHPRADRWSRHLKYSSDAGLNEARPNVNLSTCFQLAMYPCVYSRISYSRMCTCAFGYETRVYILDYSRHTHIHIDTRTCLLPPHWLYWQLYRKMRSIHSDECRFHICERTWRLQNRVMRIVFALYLHHRHLVSNLCVQSFIVMLLIISTTVLIIN